MIPGHVRPPPHPFLAHRVGPTRCRPPERPGPARAGSPRPVRARHDHRRLARAFAAGAAAKWRAGRGRVAAGVAGGGPPAALAAPGRCAPTGGVGDEAVHHGRGAAPAGPGPRVAHRGRPGWPAANQRRARWAAVPARWRRPLAADRTRAAHDGSLARRGPARHPRRHRHRPRPVRAARPRPERLRRPVAAAVQRRARRPAAQPPVGHAAADARRGPARPGAGLDRAALARRADRASADPGAGDGPGDHAARLLEAAWLGSGGQVGVPVREGNWPAGLPAWQTWVSPPLATVVRDINKFSNNVMARQLFLSLAAASNGPSNGLNGGNGTNGPNAHAGDGRNAPATLAQARAIVARQVIEATGGATSACRDEALVLDNGSGLSRQEHASARCMAQWLQAMWRSPVMPEFIASLPLNGVDGTTRRWQAAAGLAHIKTGSLDGVASVSGYVLGESGQRIVVVGLINHPRADTARPLLQALVDWSRQDR